MLRLSALIVGVLGLALLTPTATASPAHPQLLPDCAYGSSVRWLRDYEQQRVTEDAWAYADGLTGASTADRTGAARTFAAAEAAYVYGLPLVDLHDTVRNFDVRNEIISVDALSTPDNNAVVSPNVDTAYTVAWIDLIGGPVVLDVPDTRGRFYTLQLMDAYTNSFAYVGSGSTGTKAGSYALVPPGWSGDLPAGVHPIQSPTNTIWLLGRTLVRSQADLARVKPILQAYTATPLSEWQTGLRGRSVVLDSYPNRTKAAPPTGTDFVATLNQEMVIDPPPGRQKCAVTAFAPAGVQWPDPPPAEQVAADAANQAGDPPGSSGSSATDAAVAAGTAAAVKLIAAATDHLDRAASRTHRGWDVLGPWVGDYGARYLARGIVATNLLGANVPRIAMYPTDYADVAGRPLRGSRRYTITFPKGELPPVRAFWSLTMYDRQNFLYPNRIDRYAIGNRTGGLVRNPDGSLTLYLQHRAPRSRAARANWLPAPAGAFHLILRLYQPRRSALTGAWRIPPVVGRP